MKKIVSLFLACAMLLSMAMLPAFAASPTSGITFTADDGYETSSALTAAPRTIETWIKVDTDASSDRLGIIVGNYGTDGSQLDLEIRKNGNPYLFWKPYGESSVTVNFSDVDLRTGEWIHLAVVSTKAEAKCYINGELKQTVTASFNDIGADTLSKFMIGGDYRTGNTRYLQSSTVGAVALYSDSRTAEQIAADYTATECTDSALLCTYDFSVSGNARLKDYSASENHLTYTNISDSSKNEIYVEMLDGMMFDNTNGIYRIGELAGAPVTIEAEVYFSATYDVSERGGAILGNYVGSGNSCVNLEVYTNGQIRYYWRDANDDDYAAYFNANICRGEWVKIAVTHDYEAGVIKGYVNGELAGTVTDKNVGGGPVRFDNFVLGGDARSGNTQYFKGNIKSVAVYSDIRTDEEIAADATAYGTDDLILCYDLAEYKYSDRPAVISDTVGNSDAEYVAYWLDTEDTDSYAYSFAVIGDTQTLNDYYPEYFDYIYDWIVDNAEEKKIKFVFGLGDITNRSLEREWTLAIENYDKLTAAGIPYSLVRGNHDYHATSVSGRVSYDAALIGTNYDAAIPAEQRYDEASLENVYQTFTVGETKYLVICLDYGPTDEELAWAGELCETYADHKVIVTTHAYLYRDGTTLDDGDVCPPSSSDSTSNDGDDIWEEFVKHYENIVLVMSGHDPSDSIVVTKTNGVNGNTVTQMLVDPQTTEKNNGAIGMVAMLYFSEDGRNIEIEYYSTVRDRYFLSSNQFTINFDEVIGDVDLDYTVDIKDVLAALKTVVKSTALSKADMNGDGKITLIDVLRILKLAVN